MCRGCRLRCEAAVLEKAGSLALALIACAAQVTHAPPLPDRARHGMDDTDHSWRDDHGHRQGLALHTWYSSSEISFKRSACVCEGTAVPVSAACTILMILGEGKRCDQCCCCCLAHRNM